MEALKVIITVLEVIASVALVLVVLLQSGKEAGLSGAIAGGNQDTYRQQRFLYEQVQEWQPG